MLDRRALFISTLAVSLLGSLAAGYAADATPFTAAAFEAAKASGKPVLVEVTAPWCPTCKAQKPILAELRQEPRFKEMTVLEVDFDSQKDALRALNVQKQSTLIVYRGGTEMARSTGVTDKGALRAQLEKAL